MIKAGHVSLDTDTDIFNDGDAGQAVKKCRTNRYAGYTDAMWGAKTRGWVGAASRLDDNQWRVILRAAVNKVDWSTNEGDGEEGDGAGRLDPCSLIEI